VSELNALHGMYEVNVVAAVALMDAVTAAAALDVVVVEHYYGGGSRAQAP
jgi:hypothetical protein